MEERRITLAAARQMLKGAATQFPEEPLIITRDNQPILTLMTYQAHQALLANIESLQNMLEITLGSEQTDHHAKTAAKSDRHTHTSWEEFQKEVGWD